MWRQSDKFIGIIILASSLVCNLSQITAHFSQPTCKNQIDMQITTTFEMVEIFKKGSIHSLHDSTQFTWQQQWPWKIHINEIHLEIKLLNSLQFRPFSQRHRNE